MNTFVRAEVSITRPTVTRVFGFGTWHPRPTPQAPWGSCGGDDTNLPQRTYDRNVEVSGIVGTQYLGKADGTANR
jgi:hypothetical protein